MLMIAYIHVNYHIYISNTCTFIFCACSVSVIFVHIAINILDYVIYIYIYIYTYIYTTIQNFMVYIAFVYRHKCKPSVQSTNTVCIHGPPDLKKCNKPGKLSQRNIVLVCTEMNDKWITHKQTNFIIVHLVACVHLSKFCLHRPDKNSVDSDS